MKNLYKWLVGLVVVLYIVLGCNGVKADAAQTVTSNINGIYRDLTIWDIDDLDWSEWISKSSGWDSPSTLPERIIETYTHLLVTCDPGLNSPNTNSVYYCFSKSPLDLVVGSSKYNILTAYCYKNTTLVVHVDYSFSVPKVTSVTGTITPASSPSTSYHGARLYSSLHGSVVIGSNYDFLANRTESYYLDNCTRNNLSITSVPTTTCTIVVNGTTYTVTEPLPYYLALKESDGSIRLFFSDGIFTGEYADFYSQSFFSSGEMFTVISYYWDASEQNSFLDSRTVLTAPFPKPYLYLTNSVIDYMCNENIYKTCSLLDIYLPQKDSFTSSEDSLTAKDLFSVMPDELYNYNYCIVFQQNSSKAYDDRIVFYGWNDSNANLYIKKSNSQIAALTSKGSVSDYVTAYYDIDSGTWIISDDVVLGATRDGSFNLPVIYHSDVDLLVCDEWRYWEYVGYMGDSNRPIVSFEEPDEDDTLLNRFLNGFSKLFKNLFVPSDDYFSRQLASIQEHFGFWTSVRDTANVFVDFLRETDFSDPPKIQIDLSLIKSSVDYGGKVYIIDLSWYEPYKESVDVIISSILWLVFIWNTYKNLPNIIGGIGGGVQATADILNDEKGGK